MRGFPRLHALELAPRRIVAGVSLLAVAGLFAGSARAATVTVVDIRGLEDEAMEMNVRASLSLIDAIGRDLSGRRLAYLLREAENETREALEPFGYYSPTITVERTRDGETTVIGQPASGTTPEATAPPGAGVPTASSEATAPADDDLPTAESEAGAPGTRRASTSPVIVTITIAPGEPVTVRRAHVAIEGEGGDDKYLQRDLRAFQPQPGDVFDHAQYEASKTRITRRLAERGYFDADFASRQVEVTRAENAADIDLVWSSGERYDMGPVTITQTPTHIIGYGLIDRLIYWDEGSYYHQGKLDRFRESLARLDYFSGIDIEPHPEDAVDGLVPVTVTLTPAKRSIYTAGLSYGTDSGAGVRLGLERRYVNDRGHKALGQVDWAQRRKTLTLQYRVPAFAWRDGWYTLGSQFADEQTDYIDNRRIELVGSRSGEIDDRWTAVASLHLLRERWAYAAEDDGDPLTPPDYNFATFTYSSLRAQYIDTDDRLYPRDGFAGTGTVRGGLQALGSDASFLQLHVTGRWYQAVGALSRLITRAEAGHTLVDTRIAEMPPSLRFHAGGDRSIRGYAWREVGPRVGLDGDRFPIGARNVLTGSLEYEQYFGSGQWGGAVFVDSGTAFNDSPDVRTGVGIGLRWRSPVGPLRLDVAHGLDDPDSDFQIYLNIGADI